METIVEAAIRYRLKSSPDTLLMVTGRSHGECIAWFRDHDIPRSHRFDEVQGFVTSKNSRFVSREEAFIIAKCANQLKSLDSDTPCILFSENVLFNDVIQDLHKGP